MWSFVLWENAINSSLMMESKIGTSSLKNRFSREIIDISLLNILCAENKSQVLFEVPIYSRSSED